MEYVIGSSAFAAFLVLSLLGIPIAYSLGVISIIIAVLFWPTGFFVFAANPFGKMYNFEMCSLPLFVMMAGLVEASGAAEGAFDAFRKWAGRLPGSLAVASEMSAAVFAAICGVSSATTAAIGAIAVPQMLKAGYNKHLTTGCVSAGGALGVLIPPSALFIIYGVLAEVSIGKLFIAGFIPGILLCSMFIVYIVIRVWLNPSLAPGAGSFSMREKIKSTPKIFPLLLLIAAMMYCLYFGVATAAEVAALSVVFAMILAAGYRKLNWTTLKKSMLMSSRIAGFVCWIMITAIAFGVLLTHVHFTQNLSNLIADMKVEPIVVIIMINLLLIFLGCVMDAAAIVMVTVPVFVPIVNALGYDLIWFGVVFVVNMELALITPPLGLNLFVMKSIVPPDITMFDIIKGAAPFMVIDVLCLIIIIAFPKISLWLPSMMF